MSLSDSSFSYCICTSGFHNDASNFSKVARSFSTCFSLNFPSPPETITHGFGLKYWQFFTKYCISRLPTAGELQQILPDGEVSNQDPYGATLVETRATHRENFIVASSGMERPIRSPNSYPRAVNSDVRSGVLMRIE